MSLLGDGVYTVTLAWTVVTRFHTTSDLGMVLVASSLPALCATIFSGIIADKLNRRQLLLVADILRAITVGLLGFAQINGQLSLSLLIFGAACIGMAGSFFNVTYAAFLPDLVGREHLAPANSLLALLSPIMLRICGPALAGVIITTFGIAWAFWFDGITFFASMGAVLSLCLLPKRPPSTAASSSTSVWQAMKQTRWFIILISCDALLILIFWGPYQIILPPELKNRFSFSADQFALFYGSGGVGAIVGSLYFGMMRNRPSPAAAIAYWSSGCALTGLYAVGSTPIGFCVVSLLSNSFFTVGNLQASTLIQQTVPSSSLGRAFSIYIIVCGSAMQLSFLASSVLGRLIMPRNVFLVAAIASPAIAIVANVILQKQRLDTKYQANT